MIFLNFELVNINDEPSLFATPMKEFSHSKLSICMIEFSPELTALSPIFSALMFKILTLDSEKSKASFKIFINLTFLICPIEKSISTASEFILKK